MPKRKTVFDRAVKTSYANISWEVADVQKFRPQWYEGKCRAFLERIERQLAAATLLAGWEALDALIQHDERKEETGDERAHDQ